MARGATKHPAPPDYIEDEDDIMSMLEDGHASSEDIPDAIIELSEDIISDDMQSIDDDIIEVSIIELEADCASEGTVAEATAPATRRAAATSISFFILDLGGNRLT